MPSSIAEHVWSTVTANAVLWLLKLVPALLVLLVFWLVAVGIDRLMRRVGGVRFVATDAIEIIARTIKISLVLVGLVSALGTLGVNVAAMVAGLGLTGFAVGFALKDIISNALSGVLILLYQPFRRADRVSVFLSILLEGEVVHIDLRYTTLQLNDRRVLIPNSLLFTNAITVQHPSPPAQGNSVHIDPPKP